jgi:hypothetical protein
LIGEALEARRIGFLPFKQTVGIVGRRKQHWIPFSFFEKLHQNFDQALNVRWEMLVASWQLGSSFSLGTGLG